MTYDGVMVIFGQSFRLVSTEISLMSSYFFVLLFVSACSAGADISSCRRDCPTVYCARTEEESLENLKHPCVNEACKCDFNYRRDTDSNVCKPIGQCKPFKCMRTHEYYDPCPPICPNDDCDMGSCIPHYYLFSMVLECVPKCKCVNNYKRKNGICLPEKKCHKKP